MGTKNKPSEFDAYEKALPDEPMFTLLARDPLAPFLVSIWGSIRMNDLESAFVKFNAMIAKVGRHYSINPQIQEASEALGVSIEMFRYFQENSARIRSGQHGQATNEKDKG